MGRRRRPALGPVLLLLLALTGTSTASDGNVGCLFSAALCMDREEWCYDDNAFGKCLRTYGQPADEDLERHELTGDELRAFERELQRLLFLGYRWSHTYTQCVLQAMLHAVKNKLLYEPSVCDNLSDQDLTAALGALESGTEVDPKEAAFVRFTPNEGDGEDDAAADFADEVYFPPEEGTVPLPAAEQNMVDEDPSAEYELWEEAAKRALRTKHKRSNGHVFSRVYNTPGDFRRGRETKDLVMENLENIFRDDKPASDEYREPEDSLTPEEVLYLLRPENENQLKNFMAQKHYLEERRTLEDSFGHYNDDDPIGKWLESQDLDELRAMLADLDANADPYYLATSEFLTNNRLPLGSFSHQYNTPDTFRRGLETKDIHIKNNVDGEMDEPRIYVDEEDDSHREEIGSGDRDEALQHSGYFNNQIQREGTGDDGQEGQTNSALLTRLLNIWRAGSLGPPDADSPAPVYTEGGMLYLPTPTESENPERIGNSQLLDRSLGALLADYEWGFRRKERLDVKKPGPPFDTHNVHFQHDAETSTSGFAGGDPPQLVKKDAPEGGETTPHPRRSELAGEVQKSHDTFDVDSSYAYVGLKDSIRTWKEGARIVQTIGELLHLEPSAFSYPRVDRNEVTFRVEENSKSWNASEVAIRIDGIKAELKKELGVDITAAGVGDKTKYPAVVRTEGVASEWMDWDNWSETGTMWAALVAGTLAAGVAAGALFLLAKHHQRRRDKMKDFTSGDSEASHDYKDLCRQRMAGKWQSGGGITSTGGAPGNEKEGQRIASLSKDSEGNSPSTRSSTSSWSEEPALTNMDISTGHMVLTYMEDHLKNKDRLEQEWRALCAYEAEPCCVKAAEAPENGAKNRDPGVLPYDHSRIVLSDVTNASSSDYINASSITDHDPRNPAYIAAQGPLPETAADWWQMVWEQGSVVLVMLTRLSEGSVLCHRYWPEEGSQLYHIYEVHLVSEHIWCDDYLVRSFYLKNLKTGETRTVTQFHFLSWPDRGVPSSTKALLEFRRKVNKSYRGRSCPIVVHCSDGAGRTGTYCLIDMVLNRMAKGAKEIDIAATLEHIRDQRPHMVTTKQQFEFVLMAVAEEVHAILKALPAQLQQQHEKREKEIAMEKEKQEKEKEK